MATTSAENANRRARLIQRGIVVAAGTVLFLFIVYFWSQSPSEVSEDAAVDITIPRLDTTGAEESWISDGQRQLNRQDERIDRLEKLAERIEADRDKLEAENEALRQQITELTADAKAVIDSQADIIAQGTRDPFAGIPAPAADPLASPSPDPFGDTGAGSTVPQPDPLLEPPRPTLINFTLSPTAENNDGDRASPEELVKDTRFYIPAGAHAPAVITTGAAASVSVTGQADPRPVLMRITGKARTASSGRGDVLKSDIRGCTIIGEARGDLSSERVYIRLRTMTCRRGTGVVETAVQGFVAGTGQAGVRGNVITREGDLVEKSAWAGVLSGFGDAANQGLRPPTVVLEGGQRREDSAVLRDAGKAGLAKGIGNAGERLSQYFIARAEQYQPVVSLKGGTPVEVVFIAGTRLDGQDDQALLAATDEDRAGGGQ